MALGGGEDVLKLISAIQLRHQYYNYELWQEMAEIQKTNQEGVVEQAVNQFPNAIEVKIIERVEHYYEHPPDSAQ
jgi:hypothetical protein